MSKPLIECVPQSRRKLVELIEEVMNTALEIIGDDEEALEAVSRSLAKSGIIAMNGSEADAEWLRRELLSTMSLLRQLAVTN